MESIECESADRVFRYSTMRSVKVRMMSKLVRRGPRLSPDLCERFLAISASSLSQFRAKAITTDAVSHRVTQNHAMN